MSKTIHGMILSPPSRVVLLFAKFLGIKYEFVEKNLLGGKNHELIKLNPRGQIPVYVEGDFVLGESLAIIFFLFEKYGQDKKYLYPKDNEELAAKVLQRCFAIIGIQRTILNDIV